MIMLYGEFMPPPLSLKPVFARHKASDDSEFVGVVKSHKSENTEIQY